MLGPTLACWQQQGSRAVVAQKLVDHDDAEAGLSQSAARFRL